MIANDFIKSKLNSLILCFPEVKASVFFDGGVDTFYIELVPMKLYKGSDKLQKFRLSILEEFYQIYKDFSLAFVTEDNLLGIEKYDYALEGCNNQSWKCKSFKSSEVNNYFNCENLDLPLRGENNYALAA